MSRLGHQAAALTVARLASYGLLVIGPIFLVRLLSIEEFGRYREFMLYASVLQWMAAFSINDSLLYFVPAYPKSTQQILRQTVALTACSSVGVVLIALLLDRATHGTLLGQYALAVGAYVLLYVNLDFWESFLVAIHRPVLVLAYSTGRLALRLIVAVVAAALTRRVEAIILSLLVFEAIRLVASAIAWRSMVRRAAEERSAAPWQEQIRFCLPTGLTVLLIMLNRNIGNIAVTKAFGAVALAQYAIGLYGEPIFSALTMSVFTALLPEMVRLRQESNAKAIAVWQKVCVLNWLLLFPLAVFLFKYAELLLTGVFGQKYAGAVPIFQIYLLAMLRNCIDMATPLRAVSDTRPLVRTNVAALLLNAVVLLVGLRSFGMKGAVFALVLSVMVEPLYLSRRVMSHYGLRLKTLLPWTSLGKIVFAALAGGLVLYLPMWSQMRGLTAAIIPAVLYALALVLLLWLLGIPELRSLTERVRMLRRSSERDATPIAGSYNKTV